MVISEEVANFGLEIVINKGDIRRDLSKGFIRLQVNLLVDQDQLEKIVQTIIRLERGEQT